MKRSLKKRINSLNFAHWNDEQVFIKPLRFKKINNKILEIESFLRFDFFFFKGKNQINNSENNGEKNQENLPI